MSRQDAKIRSRLIVAVLAVAIAGGACSQSGTHYASCDAARAAGKAPLHRGDPGYSKALDRDGDGTACS